MCYSHATVFYGLFVRGADLVYAADAWDKLEPTLRGIDLVELRRMKGTLETAEPSSIADMPAEVWKMVKEELVSLEVARARMSVSRQLRCDDCVLEGRELASLYDVNACAECFDDFVDEGAVQGLLISHDKSLSRLLTHHNLHRPSDDLVTNGPIIFDEGALSALAFSLPSVKKLPTASTEGTDTETGHEICTFDSSVLTSLPPSAPARLRAFIRLFHLEVVDPNIYAQSAPRAELMRPHEVKKNTLIEPGWQLWAMATCC
ncbi:hypothetical protein JCM11251_001769 [Rhodosporidiobolus azoricus]